MQHFGVWIGLYRKPDNEFYWIDDTPVTGQFSAWAKGEPNSGQEKCANIFAGKLSPLGKWNDIRCNLAREFQQSARSLPERLTINQPIHKFHLNVM